MLRFMVACFLVVMASGFGFGQDRFPRLRALFGGGGGGQVCSDGYCGSSSGGDLVSSAAAVADVVVDPAATQWYQVLRADGVLAAEVDRAARLHGYRAARVTVDGVCGSGSFCGRDGFGCYVLTNAHVAGTRPGRVVNVEYVERSSMQPRKVRSIIALAAYSDRSLTDWCLLRLDPTEFAGYEPFKLSKVKPADFSGYFFTWGCPRCDIVSGQAVRTREAGNPWKWSPISIGGQSGSGVVRDLRQFGLLTWSWGGLGAGQHTSEIYRQAIGRTSAGDGRPDGLVELASDRSETEEGFFELAGGVESGIADLPIWFEEGGPVEPPGDDVCPLTEKETKVIKLLRETALSDVDWFEVLKKVLELLALFK